VQEVLEKRSGKIAREMKLEQMGWDIFEKKKAS